MRRETGGRDLLTRYCVRTIFDEEETATVIKLAYDIAKAAGLNDWIKSKVGISNRSTIKRN